MRGKRAWIVGLSVATALLMIGLPATSLVPTLARPASSTGPEGASAGPAPAAVNSPAASLISQRVKELSHEPGLPAAARLEPNIAYASVREGSALVPMNLANGQVGTGPTSIGVNDLGLRTNSMGEFVPYSYRTTSLVGSVSLNSMSLLPVMANVSDGITVQENAVLNNVTIWGQSVNQIWAQNVILYSVTGNQLQLLTDAWNFTGPPFSLFQNSIYANSPGGYDFGGVYVHQVPLAPPAFIVRMPFTIRLYLNATNVEGRNALFFNYTLNSAHDIFLDGKNLGTSIEDGSFDWIIFNSTAGMPAGYTAPPASFLISGSQATGIGLANDAEIALCGPSDGYSAVFRSLSATAQLQYLNGTSGTYSAVPAAFTTTEDTGESVEGVDVHYTASTAHAGAAILSAGPEFVYGLWNATPGIERRFSVDLSPSTGVLWVAPILGSGSVFQNDSAAWAIGTGPDLTFWLPTSSSLTYNGLAMANDYDLQLDPLLVPGPPVAIHLSSDPSQGVYVPVLAFGNSQVAALATSGSGTAADPYMIRLHQYQPIMALYGTFDEFTEPLYPGLLFSGVTAHVDVVNPPSFRIVLSAADLFPLIYFWGLNPPVQNYLPIELYDSSNLSVVRATFVSGWFPVTLTGFLYGSLYLSDVTDSLVAYDHFSSMGSSMVIVEPQGNATRENDTVFGNSFTVNPIVSGPNGSSLLRVDPFNTTYTGGPAVGGLGVLSEGNTIYGNLFATPIGAYSPPQNPLLAYMFVNDLGYHDFVQVSTSWSNQWNLPLEPWWFLRWVNGFPLVGSVDGAPFQGGNGWSTWNGSVPYTDRGLIPTAGDALPVPLPGQSFHAVVLGEVGLPSGTPWTAEVNGTWVASSQLLALAYVHNGPVSVVIPMAAGLTPVPSSFSITVNQNRFVPIFFV